MYLNEKKMNSPQRFAKEIIGMLLLARLNNP